MTLHTHVDSEKIVHSALAKDQVEITASDNYLSQFSANKFVPKFSVPEEPTDPEQVYDLLHNELTLDGNPALNLALFVTTQVEVQAARLAAENLVKNLADNDEYPALLKMHERCVLMISNLWHGEPGSATGTATTGSLEAIMLGGLALKRTWEAKRKAAGKSIDKPNILMALCVQVALEKFARYFDVEDRLIPINEELGHMIDVLRIREQVDENTIGIFVIMGTTFTGGFEPVKEISELLDEIEKETGILVPIHVDGASGGFVAPFLFPDLEWDFRVPRVVSINTSGHKFGLVLAGLGWIIWRNLELLPENLKFELDYLGGIEETYTLNFSRPGFPVIHQYYNFLRLGKQGYTKTFNLCLQNARLFARALDASGYYEAVLPIHKPWHPKHEQAVSGDKTASNHALYTPGLPVVAFRFSKLFSDKYHEIPQVVVLLYLRNKGWIVPNYRLTPDEHEVEVLRVVVRPLVTLDLIETLVTDLVSCAEVVSHAIELIKDLHDDPERRRQEAYAVMLSLSSQGKVTPEEIAKRFADKQAVPDRNHRGAC